LAGRQSITKCPIWPDISSVSQTITRSKNQGRRRLDKEFLHKRQKKYAEKNTDLFKNNQEWIVNGLSSSKLSAAAYGRQALQYSSQYVGTNFFGDINLATGSAVTSQVANGSELYYGTSKVTTTFTNSEYTTSYVSIYEIEPRFHMTLESTFGPTTLWKQGIEDMYGGTVNPQTGVYNVPFESPMFVHFYKSKQNN